MTCLPNCHPFLCRIDLFDAILLVNRPAWRCLGSAVAHQYLPLLCMALF